jgi:hypothetical protein
MKNYNLNMRKFNLQHMFPLMLVFMAIIFTNCSDANKDFKVVKILGVSGCSNFSKHNMSFVILDNKYGSVSVIVQDGDLLYLTLNGKNVYYRYDDKDGPLLNFNSEGSKIFLNNKLTAFVFSNDGDPEKLAGLDRNGLKDLRSIQIDCPLEAKKIEILRTVAEQNNIRGIVKSDDFDADLSFLNPEWFVGFDSDRIGSRNLKLSCIQAERMKDFGNFKNSKRLESLILIGWNPDITGPIPSTLAGLTGLSIQVSGSFKTGYVANCRHLKSLTIYKGKEGDLVTDKDLMDIPVFIPVACTVEKEAGKLKEFRNLKYFRFPQNVSQENFDAVIGNNRGLRFVELFKLEKVKNFDALNKLPGLKGLVIDGTDMDLEFLTGLKNLKILILQTEKYKANAGIISQIEKSLPGCEIVPGEGICLGSAWILILPAFILTFVLVRRKLIDNVKR